MKSLFAFALLVFVVESAFAQPPLRSDAVPTQVPDTALNAVPTGVYYGNPYSKPMHLDTIKAPSDSIPPKTRRGKKK